MKYRGLAVIAAILVLSACGAAEIRCDHDLQPINPPSATPVPSADPRAVGVAAAKQSAP